MLAYFRKLTIGLSDTLLSTNTIISKLAIAVLTFYAPIQSYAISIALLVILDVITGLWATRIKGEPFKSRTLRKGLLEKLALYGMLFTGTIILGNVFEKVIHFKEYYIAWLFTILVSVYELSSIIENVITIKPELAFLNKIKDLLTSVEKKQLEEAEKKLSVITDDKKKDKEEDDK